MATRPRIRYGKVKDGWPFYVTKDGHKLACCDCGLVHRIYFTVLVERRGKLVELPDAKLQIVGKRDKRATAARRRGRGLFCRPPQ